MLNKVGTIEFTVMCGVVAYTKKTIQPRSYGAGFQCFHITLN